MKVEFRADASPDIGSGHVMRCLALAQALKERGVESRFVSSGSLLGHIQSQGFPVGAELGRADWLVVDHYGLDAGWEAKARGTASRILAIDDLARGHDCDLLLDQNFFPDAHSRYAGKLPVRSRVLLGPRHALLRPEFALARASLRPRHGRVRRVLLSLGGADAPNETTNAIEALRALQHPDLEVDVVIGAANPHGEAISALCADAPGYRLHRAATNMAELMAAADFAIGAGGSSTWERCCLGLPTLQVAIAENQVAPSRALAAAGLVFYAGATVSTRSIGLAMNDAAALREQARRVSALVDGQGARRVAAAMLASASTRLQLREARAADVRLYFAWTNDPEVRRQSFDSRPIEWPGHQAWFAQRRAQALLLLAEEECGFPVGQVRFERSTEGWRINYSLDEAFRGAGLAAKMLQLAIHELRRRHPGGRLRAAVRGGNIASHKVFAALGFAQLSETMYELNP